MKVFLHFLLLVSARTAASARGECNDAAVKARLACYDREHGPACENLPIPASAFGPETDQNKGYYIHTLRPGMYVVSETTYMSMVVVSELHDDRYEVAIFDFPEGNFVIRDDTGQVVGNLITAAIDEIVFEMHGLEAGDIEKVQCVYSHAHFDHIGGATIAYDHIVENWGVLDIDIIAHEGTLAEFEERIEAGFFSNRAPLPTTVVDEERTFKVGRDFKYTLLPAMGHSDEKDLVVFFERDDAYPAVMMFADIVFPGWAPFFSFALSTNLFHFLAVHDILLTHFDLGEDGIFIGGHLTKTGTKADIQLSLDFTWAVLDGAMEGLRTVDFNAIAADSGVFDTDSNNYGNKWLLFDKYFKAVNKVCAKQVVAEYGCKLAAIDMVIDSHCNFANSFWRLDY